MNDLSKLISNYDIENKLRGYHINILTYAHLTEYNDLSELLPFEMCACFILIRTSESSGHWTCIVRHGNNIYYFDSYGVVADGELTHISKNLRYELHENKRLLSAIINNSISFNILYNHFQFQSYHTQINTCGRYVTVFTLSVFEGGNIKSFTTMMKRLVKQYKAKHGNANYVYDIVVTKLYNEI